MWCPLPIKMIQLRQIFVDTHKLLLQMLRTFMCIFQCLGQRTIILFDFPQKTTQLACRRSKGNYIWTGSERNHVLRRTGQVQFGSV